MHCSDFNAGYQAGLAEAEKLVAKERADTLAWLCDQDVCDYTGVEDYRKIVDAYERLEHINASGAGVEGGGK
jgi:hypothetical protein